MKSLKKRLGCLFFLCPFLFSCMPVLTFDDEKMLIDLRYVQKKLNIDAQLSYLSDNCEDVIIKKLEEIRKKFSRELSNEIVDFKKSVHIFKRLKKLCISDKMQISRSLLNDIFSPDQVEMLLTSYLRFIVSEDFHDFFKFIVFFIENNKDYPYISHFLILVLIKIFLNKLYVFKKMMNLLLFNSETNKYLFNYFYNISKMLDDLILNLCNINFLLMKSIIENISIFSKETYNQHYINMFIDFRQNVAFLNKDQTQKLISDIWE